MHTNPPATFDLTMNFDLADLENFPSIDSVGVVKISCHCTVVVLCHEGLENTVKEEATSSDEVLEGLLDMIVS